MNAPVLRNYINGQWVESATGKLQEQRNPANLEQVTCRFQDSSRQEAAGAIDAAQAAHAHWSGLPAAQRAQILRAALANLSARQEEIARIITLENGKTLRESLGEINAALREMDWQIAQGLRLAGQVLPSENAGVFAYSLRQSLGVVSIISPWNFPLNVACRKCVPALMAGNTAVFKPASLTPHTGVAFVEAFAQAGLPPGVLNLVSGGGSTVGDELVVNALVKAISFTGSTPVGMGIHAKAARTLARTQLEMGGKNPAVVLADADLDAAATAIALAAYACAGQWCTSTSRALVEQSVAEPFTAKLLEKVAAIRAGNGLEPSASMGPVCGQQQLTDIMRYIDLAQSQGAKLLAGGQRLTDHGRDRGCFIAPTVFGAVTPDMAIAREEIFGPVLAVMAVKDFDQAVSVANDVQFGLSSSIFTRSLDKALAFVQRSDVGLTHVNMPTAHKEPQLPFGGIKESGVGLPEAGESGIEFFTRHKVVYIRA